MRRWRSQPSLSQYVCATARRSDGYCSWVSSLGKWDIRVWQRYICTEYTYVQFITIVACVRYLEGSLCVQYIRSTEYDPAWSVWLLLISSTFAWSLLYIQTSRGFRDIKNHWTWDGSVRNLPLKMDLDLFEAFISSSATQMEPLFPRCETAYHRASGRGMTGHSHRQWGMEGIETWSRSLRVSKHLSWCHERTITGDEIPLCEAW